MPAALSSPCAIASKAFEMPSLNAVLAHSTKPAEIDTTSPSFTLSPHYEDNKNLNSEQTFPSDTNDNTPIAPLPYPEIDGVLSSSQSSRSEIDKTTVSTTLSSTAGDVESPPSAQSPLSKADKKLIFVQPFQSDANKITSSAPSPIAGDVENPPSIQFPHSETDGNLISVQPL